MFHDVVQGSQRTRTTVWSDCPTPQPCTPRSFFGDLLQLDHILRHVSVAGQEGDPRRRQPEICLEPILVGCPVEDNFSASLKYETLCYSYFTHTCKSCCRAGGLRWVDRSFQTQTSPQGGTRSEAPLSEYTWAVLLLSPQPAAQVLGPPRRKSPTSLPYWA